MLVNPIERPADHVLRVIAELVECADRRVAGNGLAFFALFLISPQIFSGHFSVCKRRERTQQHTAPGMKRKAAGNVLMMGNEVHHCTNFRLGSGIRAGAELFMFLPPARGEIAVQVDPLFILVYLYRVAVVITHRAFGQHAIVNAAILGWLTRHHQARLGGMTFPVAVLILDAHGQNTAIAIHVANIQALNGILVIGISTGGGTNNFGSVTHRPFRAIRIHARANVDGTSIEQAGDLLATRIGFSISFSQRINKIHGRRTSSQLTRVNIRIHPIRRFISRGTGFLICRRKHPDVTALMAFADAFNGEQTRKRVNKILQQLGEFGVAIETIVFWLGKSHFWEGKS